MSDRRDDAFQRALDEARRKDRALNDDGAGPAGGPRVRASFEFGPAPSCGGEARFGLALDWTDGPVDRLGLQAPASRDEATPDPADAPAEIAAELGLGAPLTPGSARVPLAQFRLAQSSRPPAG